MENVVFNLSKHYETSEAERIEKIKRHVLSILARTKKFQSTNSYEETENLEEKAAKDMKAAFDAKLKELIKTL